MSLSYLIPKPCNQSRAQVDLGKQIRDKRESADAWLHMNGTTAMKFFCIPRACARNRSELTWYQDFLGKMAGFCERSWAL